MAQRDELLKLCSGIIAADKRINDCEADEVRINVLMETREPWKALDRPTNFTGTKKTRFFIGIALLGTHKNHKTLTDLTDGFLVDIDFGLRDTLQNNNHWAPPAITVTFAQRRFPT